jgi:hypothetical protein
MKSVQQLGPCNGRVPACLLRSGHETVQKEAAGLIDAAFGMTSGSKREYLIRVRSPLYGRVRA